MALSRSIWNWMDSAIMLKDVARAASSSSPLTASGSSSLPSARRLAARDVRRTGMRTRQVKIATARMMMRRKPTPVRTTERVTVSTTCCCDSRE